MYSAKLLDHFHHPRHAGQMENPTAVVELSNPACGDLMKIWVRVEGGRICEVKFQAAGCVPVVACGSWLAEHMHGRATSDLGRRSPEEIENALGGLPEASKHAAVLASEVLKSLLSRI